MLWRYLSSMKLAIYSAATSILFGSSIATFVSKQKAEAR
jgi:hypothetical protein